MSSLVALTYARVESISALPSFVRLSVRSAREAAATPGNRGVKIKVRGPLSWYTLTAWEDANAMLRFVKGETHRTAMRASSKLTSATAFARMEIDGRISDLKWSDVYDRLGHAPGSARSSPEEPVTSR